MCASQMIAQPHMVPNQIPKTETLYFNSSQIEVSRNLLHSRKQYKTETVGELFKEV